MVLHHEKFRKWRDSGFSFLWVTAGPGCGKAVLSRALIDEGRLSTNVSTSTVCYFFFKDGDEHHMYATNALSAILQLFTQASVGDLIKYAVPSYENFGRGLTQNFPELWRILVNCACSPDAGGIICVLDDLDECPPESRRQLLSELREFYCGPWRFTDSLPRLRFLIISRPYDDLEFSFRRLSDTIAYAALESKMWPRENFKNMVKYLCGLFVRVYNSKLSFIHQTAREFLIHWERNGNWQGRFDLTRSHAKMSLICLEYLSYLDEEKSVDSIRADCPLAVYAAKFWMSHAKLAETEQDVQENCLNFFLQQEQAYKVWDKLFDPDFPSSTIAGPVRCQMPAPLYFAAMAGLRCIAELLLQEGVNINAEGGKYGNALQAASRKGHKEIARLLLENGAYANARGGYFCNALQAASFIGHKELAELLLERSANVNSHGGRYGNALRAAFVMGCRDLVELLLEKGADVNAQGGIYGSALQAASR